MDTFVFLNYILIVCEGSNSFVFFNRSKKFYFVRFLTGQSFSKIVRSIKSFVDGRVLLHIVSSQTNNSGIWFCQFFCVNCGNLRVITWLLYDWTLFQSNLSITFKIIFSGTTFKELIWLSVTMMEELHCI